ncbi:DUF4179 domain-containing protein, partial [Clostridium sp.]|uniref:DUF4179 domain-containing protein n=1 Tax=Clostridium sp. TaxID=1506 RepID=UPI003F2A320B
MSNLDNINIPNNLREITKDTIKKGIYLKKRKNIKKFKVASLLVLTLSTSLAIINPSLANNRISITDLFEILGYDSYDKYVQSIDTTKTVGDVSLTIGDIICDGSTINFTYTIKSKNKLPRKTSELVFDQLDEPLIRDETFILDSNIKVKNAITS